MEAIHKVGLFGLLGSGNIGNDASMESVLTYLRADHPDAVVDAMCLEPEKLRDQYGVEAVPIQWYVKYDHHVPDVIAIPLKVLGKGIDAFRTALWVRKHDIVIVPGMGVLESSLPLRASGFPYSMFLLCASGKLFRTKVALVSVGATVVRQRLMRWLFISAAKLAFYRSYRDVLSRDALTQQGLDTAQDSVYPDLAFGIPTAFQPPYDAMIVGVGVMEYYGTNDDRRHAEKIHASYVENIKSFIEWLVDGGRQVRLFVGDACDYTIVQDILIHLREQRPDLEPAQVIAEHISSFADLARAMQPVGIVVATRYHNVLCALRLLKPTISLGYAAKNNVLMADMGLAEFCQSASSVNFDLLIGQFRELESRSAQLKLAMADRCSTQEQRLDQQFAELSAVLFSAEDGACARAGRNSLVAASLRPGQRRS